MMKGNLIVFFFVLFFQSTSPLAADVSEEINQEQRIAVFEFSGLGVSTGKTKRLSEYFRRVLAQRLSIVPAAEMALASTREDYKNI